MASFDLVVVGAGILGLAHALAAARRGLRVAVLERDAQACSASTRNFGFVTISGQDAGATHRRAMRSREVWEQVAPEAGIAIVQRGALVAARHPEALAVLREYAASAVGADCRVLDAAQARARLPQLRDPVGALESPHELRFEARTALGLLARWLEEFHGVVFSWDTTAFAIEGDRLRHSRGAIAAGAFVVTPGVAVAAFAPRLAQRVHLRQCALQMLRLAPVAGLTLPAVLMADLSLLRYAGFAAQPSAGALRARLESRYPRELAHGVHLIVAQGADGSLVVGDSHHYSDHATPFASGEVEALILGELRAVLALPEPTVLERWSGYYPVADVKPVLAEEIGPRAHLVTVTAGTGMSTAFAIGEETVATLFG
jgi:FAD dependent oxidoreductase TIGR03364